MAKTLLRSNSNNFLRFGKPLEAMTLASIVGQELSFIDVPPISNAVSSLVANAIDSSEIQLTWVLSDINLDSIEIHRSESANGPFTLIDSIDGSLDSYSDTGLNSDTTYYYTIRGDISGSYTDFSNISNATTEAGAIIVPDNVSVTADSDTEITGSALAGEAYDDGAKVYYSTVSGGPYTLLNTIAGPLANNDPIAISGTGLIAETTYYFVVRGIVGGVESDNSTEASATTLEAEQINFLAGFNGRVESVAVDSSDDIYCVGDFTTYDGTACNRIVKLHGSGVNKYDIDTSFNYGTGFNAKVWALKINASGKILVGGDFTSYNGTTAYRIIKLDPDGSITSGFSSATTLTGGPVYDIDVDSNDDIYIVGGFTTYGGGSRNFIMRLNSNGSEDAGFVVGTGFSSDVYSLRVDSSDNVYVGGAFTTWKGSTNNRIIKLDSTGTKDATFDNTTGFNSLVFCIDIDGSGKLYAGGFFTSYKGSGYNRVIKLNTDGSIDGTLSIGTGFNSAVRSVYVDSRGGIIVRGDYSNYNGSSSSRISRISTTGTLDATFLPAGTTTTGPPTRSIIENSTGSLFIGGGFTLIDSQATGRFVKLNFYA